MRLAPFAFKVVGFVDALVAASNVGLKGSALQLPTENGLDTPCVVPDVEVSDESVASGPQ